MIALHPDSSFVGERDLHRLSNEGRVHFMGVGGAGMCALAELFVKRGGNVSGCDLRPGSSTDRLRTLDVQIHKGHEASHVEGAAALVVSAAVPKDHPEVQEALQRGIPVFKRAEALGQSVNQGRVLAVAGTHGKTSTTAMATEILAAAGMDPTGFVGGRVSAWGGNLRSGGDLYVVEADEYDRSFLELKPAVAVVTNVEADHLDTYGALQGVMKAFQEFLDGLLPDGSAVICADDHGASRLVTGLESRVRTYGLRAGAQVRAVDVKVSAAGMDFRVIDEGVDRGTFRLPGARSSQSAKCAGRRSCGSVLRGGLGHRPRRAHDLSGCREEIRNGRCGAGDPDRGRLRPSPLGDPGCPGGRAGRPPGPPDRGRFSTAPVHTHTRFRR